MANPRLTRIEAAKLYAEIEELKRRVVSSECAADMFRYALETLISKQTTKRELDE